jgi:hypothetical protein
MFATATPASVPSALARNVAVACASAAIVARLVMSPRSPASSASASRTICNRAWVVRSEWSCRGWGTRHASQPRHPLWMGRRSACPQCGVLRAGRGLSLSLRPVPSRRLYGEGPKNTRTTVQTAFAEKRSRGLKRCSSVTVGGSSERGWKWSGRVPRPRLGFPANLSDGLRGVERRRHSDVFSSRAACEGASSACVPSIRRVGHSRTRLGSSRLAGTGSCKAVHGMNRHVR